MSIDTPDLTELKARINAAFGPSLAEFQSMARHQLRHDSLLVSFDEERKVMVCKVREPLSEEQAALLEALCTQHISITIGYEVRLPLTFSQAVQEGVRIIIAESKKSDMIPSFYKECEAVARYVLKADGVEEPSDELVIPLADAIYAEF